MKKIGLFDSGVGGLSVLKMLIPYFPSVDFIYFADTLNLPYGEKNQKELKQYCVQVQNFLISQSVDVMIVACNTASTLYVGSTHYKEVPLFNIITPTVESAVSLSHLNDKVGVLATSFTVSSEIYPELLLKALPSLKVYQQVASLLAGAVEKNINFLEESRPLLQKYLNPLMEKKIDTLILGCAHYFFLLDEIKKILPYVQIICSCGEGLISRINECLKGDSKDQESSIFVYVSKDSPHFTSTTQQILDNHSVTIQEVVLNSTS